MKSARMLASVFVTRGGAAVGGILFSLLIARVSGPEELGRFALFLSVLGACAILARRGLDVLLIRAVAKAELKEACGLPIQLFRHGLGKALPTAFALAVPAATLLGMEWLGISIPGGVVAILICLPMLTALALISGFLKGAGRPWLAPLFEIGGISLLTSILMIGVLIIGLSVNTVDILLLFTIAMGLLCGLGYVAVQRAVQVNLWTWVVPPLSSEHRAELSRGQLEFTLIALSTFLVQAGSFTLVAPYLSEQLLGFVRASERLALVISFPVLAIEPFIAARIVRHVQRGDRMALWRLVAKAMLGGGAIVIPILLLFIIAPQIPLQWMGEEFVAAAPYLRVMALAHFAAVLLGPFVMVLNMGGGEREAMRVALTALFIALILYPSAAAIWGGAGFVGAYAFLTIARAGWITMLAYRHISRVVSPAADGLQI